ncbi:MAG: DUF839 domain-containing protein [Myxococcota bacterium]
MNSKQLRFAGTFAAGIALAGTSATAGTFTGPSSSATPYVVPTIAGVDITSILTTGDSVGGYQMTGIPDGLGAFSNGDGTFTLLMNHELTRTQSIVRDHGAAGAFVSEWRINTGSLAVTFGDDQIKNLILTDVQAGDTAGGLSALQLGRLCSADLAAPSAYYNAASGLGTTERIFMNGEENGSEGRAFAHVVTGANDGTSWQLPALGRFSWENSVAAPGSGDKTVVMGMDDTTPGQLYVYVGDKTNSGSEIDKAGLTNGSVFGVRVLGGAPADEARATGFGAGKGASLDFDLVAQAPQTGVTGAALQTASEASGVSEFLRPEDGAWDPNHPNDFYFVTTDRFNNPAPNEGRSRLWKMTFDDVSNPQAGGKLTMVLDGSEGQQMFDNITIDKHGRILLQEDPGNNTHIAKIWSYDIATGTQAVIAQFDPARFGTPAQAPFNNDEESSGIIDVTDLFDPTGVTGKGYALFDAQAHYANGATLVEGGQLMLMTYDLNVVPEPGTAVLMMLGLAGLASSRANRGKR